MSNTPNLPKIQTKKNDIHKNTTHLDTIWIKMTIDVNKHKQEVTIDAGSQKRTSTTQTGTYF